MSDAPRHVVLATSAAFADLVDDDRLLLDALHARGVPTSVRVWSDADAWNGAPALVVIRSCWDYHTRLDEFLAWLDALDAAGHVVRNPTSVLRWNARKRYLLALADAGIAIAPTIVLGAHDADSARARTDALVAEDRATWEHVVVKPEVSASSFETWRTSLPLDDFAARRLAGSLARRDLLVQAFLPGIAERGEMSLVFLAGAFSHAVSKHPALGDFRVQAEHGGHATTIMPEPMTLAWAERLLNVALPLAGIARRDLLYARVDALAPAPGSDADPMLMELELVEPSLYLVHDVGAPERLADAIVRQLASPAPSSV